MEYIDKGDLLTHIKNNGKFREQEFKPIFRQIVKSLYYLHSENILHRDIKLDNILLNKNGDIKICDFGVSRKMKSNRIIFEHIGTPAYLAPEIVIEKGYTGFQADV